MIIPRAKYITVSDGGVEFIVPPHPGHYPLNALDDPKVQARQEGEHKGKVKEHNICTGVNEVMKDFIC